MHCHVFSYDQATTDDLMLIVGGGSIASRAASRAAIGCRRGSGIPGNPTNHNGQPSHRYR